MFNGPNPQTILADTENLEATISTVKERARKLQDEVAALEAQVARARGTGDHTAAAGALTKPVKLDTGARIEAALRGKVLTVEELAREIGESVSKTANALRTVRKSLGNVGTAAAARWTWRIGDRTSTEELQALVLRLILEQPLTTAELVAATGARAARVGGALVAIQRSGAQVLNLGTQKRHRWFVVPPHAADARLQPKRKPEEE